MKFGVRECCDVVLRAKAAQKIGNKIFYKNEPVCYFDTLKTSTLEGAATTVYAQGGRGNARLMSWDGERTVTFTMEDALISPIGLAILTGAGLIEATAGDPIIQHVTEIVKKPKIFNTSNNWELELTKVPYQEKNDLNIYVMGLDSHGEVNTEPFLYKQAPAATDAEKGYTLVDFVVTATNFGNQDLYTNEGTENAPNYQKATAFSDEVEDYYIQLNKSRRIIFAGQTGTDMNYAVDGHAVHYGTLTDKTPNDSEKFIVDYYRAVDSGAFQVDIAPDKFGGAFYLEASTLWRDQGTGQDLPAEFIIPNCRVQSNFTFTMASSGDPSSFTFTMDAFPDYTRYDSTEKVLARIQVIDATEEGIADIYRTETWSKDGNNTVFGGVKEKPGQRADSGDVYKTQD